MTPRFSPLDMTNDNKAVLAFNLSYLFDEAEMLATSMHQITSWFEEGALRMPSVQEFSLSRVAAAHEALQSGETVGRLLLVP
jgi:NADPH:quinone reductase-like Zn-dependent oxidoreductase